MRSTTRVSRSARPHACGERPAGFTRCSRDTWAAVDDGLIAEGRMRRRQRPENVELAKKGDALPLRNGSASIRCC
jgi:hypothetical protein